MAITAIVQGGTLTALVQGGTLTALVQGEVAPVVEVPEKSISHVTIDAGVDLRKKSQQRQKQILKLRVEIPCIGTAKKTEQLEIPAEGTAKKTEELSYKVKGTAKITNKISIKAIGSALSKQFTAISVKGEKSSEMYGMKRTIKKLRLLDTLKEALRELDDK